MNAADLAQSAWAIKSRDGAYRYWLHRRNEHGKGWAVFLMLNPSIADAQRADPTMRRCREFSRMWDHAGFVIVNLFAAISTQPEALLEHDAPIGPENDRYIKSAVEMSRDGGTFICGWGAHDFASPRVSEVMKMLRHVKRLKPMCLGYTKGRMPRHPLFVAGNVQPEPFIPFSI